MLRPVSLLFLDRKIGSMTEFKQIIGRGTRNQRRLQQVLLHDYGFQGERRLNFADPDFDGDPVQIYEPKEGDPIEPPDDSTANVADDRAPTVIGRSFFPDAPDSGKPASITSMTLKSPSQRNASIS